MSNLRRSAAVVALLLAACGDESPEFVDAPSVDAAIGVDAPLSDATAPDAPIADAPVADAPVADAPVADAGPIADAPIADAPVADAGPIADAPIADAAIADAPIADAGPVADAPVADAPIADAPIADAPITDAPIVDAGPIVDAAPPADAAVDAPLPDAAPANRAPIVAATISGPGTLRAGDTGAFDITASDPDGDPLTFAWTQTAPAANGTWTTGQAAATAGWRSPAVATATAFTLQVTVSDGLAPAVARTLTLTATVPHFTDVQAVFDAAPCTGCHGTSGGLGLGAAVSYANLVNVTANNATCSPLKRVLPGDPDNSVLVRKIQGTTCGNRMPRNNPTYFDINPGLVVRVRSWILAGALNN